MARPASVVTLCVVLALAGPVSSLAGVVSQRTSTDPEDWTAERLADARAMPLREVRSIDLARIRDSGAARDLGSRRAGPAGSPASPPRRRVAPGFGNRLFDPSLSSSRGGRPGRSRVAATRLEALEPSNRGAFALDFSSSRLVPEDARVVWPYSTVGKLYLSGAGEDFVCSASVISARVVLTAGHCVYDAAADQFYHSFTFVPAYHRGEAPYGTWTPDFVAATDTWIEGGDEVPNGADFGVLVMRDRDGMKIGDVTGWLGYKLNELVPNHLKLLGYPVDFDSGQRLHQVDSGAFQCCFDDTAVYGSDMKGGSSGGPWIQNFGVRANGQRGGENRRMNRIVGVTSYGPVGRVDKFQGSSIPDSEFAALFEQACDQAPGNCAGKGRPRKN